MLKFNVLLLISFCSRDTESRRPDFSMEVKHKFQTHEDTSACTNPTIIILNLSF